MQRSLIRIGFLSLFLTAIGSLQGCTDVAMSGAQIVYNHHSIQKSLNDQYITMKAYQALNIDNVQFKNANIAIATFNGEVLLAGQTPSAFQKLKAGQLVKQIDGVKDVYNLVTISNPSSSLTRISDAWITAKVKAKLIASDDVDATQVKVVTENGTVYLMGILQPSEADAAVEIARETDGVESVVKIFSYMKITKKA